MDNFDAAYLAHEYRLARIRITELMMSAPDDWSRLPVPTCPAWDVHDLLAVSYTHLTLPTKRIV